MLCPHYKSCKWFTLTTIQKVDGGCEHFYHDTKDKPFCGHFPHDFKKDFPPIDILEYYDPKTYTRERTAPRSDIHVEMIQRKVVEPPVPPEPVKKARKQKAKKEVEPPPPEPNAPPPQVKKERKPRVIKEEPPAPKIIVEEKPKMKETPINQKNLVYDLDDDW